MPLGVAGLLLAAGGFAQDVAPADRNEVNTRVRPGGMLADSPVTFSESGALPAQFPPDVRAEQFDPGEADYFLFSSPERSLAQVKQIQAAMPAGRFTPPANDWRHLPRSRRRLAEGGPLHVMAIGDSIVNDTMRSGWVALLREAYPRADITATVHVRGGGGAQHFREAGRLARNVFPRRPDLVFLGGISQRSIEDLAVLIGQLRAGLPEVEILLGTGAFGTADPRDPAALAAAPHSGTGDYGRRLRELAEAERCAFLDFTTPWAEYLNGSGQHPHRFYRDVVHANEFGEQVLAKILMSFWQPGASAAPDLTRPVVGPELVFEERDGLVVVEAEHFYQQTLTEKRAWHFTSPRHTPDILPDGDPPHLEGASGGAYVEILPDTRRTHDDPLIHGENFSNQPGRLGVLHYKVHFNNPGRYYVWARAYSTGTEDNGLHVGLNGQWPASGQRLQWCEGKDSWRWESKQRTEREHCGEPHLIHLDIPAAGEHEVQFSMREDGFEFDKFILTTNRGFARPEGVGPVSRVRHGVLPAALAAAAPQAAAPAHGDKARRPFPAHWGSPPQIQTMDYRPLPGGY
ncbi:MAG TPA: hypothetical protein PKE47_04730, partial [Verrucomicrobiota bacterium]|nr:hypothetical protein [Verrucomicrobiota bacterium]